MISPSRRRLRTLALGAIPIVVLGGLVTVDHVPGTDISLTVPYAAEGPGPTVDTLGVVDGTDVVAVQADKVDHPSGHLNMTTVSVRTNMTLAQALSRWLTTDDTIVPLDTVIPTNMTNEEVNEVNQQAFTESESSATIAAMNYLKIPVAITVVQVLDGSGAKDKVQVDDVITAVDGKKVTKPSEVQEQVRAKKPGDEITLTILRGGSQREETITLGEHPHDSSVPLMGISMGSKPSTDIDVKYNLQDIGGPSAGMMFTLAVIDKLSPGDLSGGKFVAGTGTISDDGTVGPIGGIAHKVAAAKAAGAELFLAPADNCAEATSKDHAGMTIAKVSTLDDSVAAMRDFAAGKPIETCD